MTRKTDDKAGEKEKLNKKCSRIPANQAMDMFCKRDADWRDSTECETPTQALERIGNLEDKVLALESKIETLNTELRRAHHEALMKTEAAREFAEKLKKAEGALDTLIFSLQMMIINFNGGVSGLTPQQVFDGAIQARETGKHIRDQIRGKK